jgi:hypothetical protein
MEHIIAISQEGVATFVWSDDLAKLKTEGECKIERVSNVEPNEQSEWMADMMLIGGPILGPFETRQEAIDAELRYIRERFGL